MNPPSTITDHELQLLRKDAERWRYTQRTGYFVCGPYSYSTNGDWMGYSVGTKGPNEPINPNVKGHGKTLQSAIDDALSKE